MFWALSTKALILLTSFLQFLHIILEIKDYRLCWINFASFFNFRVHIFSFTQNTTQL